MSRTFFNRGGLLLLLVPFLVACTTTVSTSSGKVPSGNEAKFCVSARRVFYAIDAFGSGKSRVFDATARSKAESLLSEAKGAIKLTSSAKMRTALNEISNSVQAIMDDVSPNSPNTLKRLTSATAQYLQATTTFKTLELEIC